MNCIFKSDKLKTKSQLKARGLLCVIGMLGVKYEKHICEWVGDRIV